jgi:hypothetical protein
MKMLISSVMVFAFSVRCMAFRNTQVDSGFFFECFNRGTNLSRTKSFEPPCLQFSYPCIDRTFPRSFKSNFVKRQPLKVLPYFLKIWVNRLLWSTKGTIQRFPESFFCNFLNHLAKQLNQPLSPFSVFIILLQEA